jgi:hypothetical protein
MMPSEVENPPATENSPVDCSSRSTVDDDAVGRRTGLGRDLDRLEVAEILQSPLGAIDQGAVVGIAFDDVEFAPDDVVAGAGVAAQVDALDIGVRAFLDHEGHVDDSLFGNAVAARARGSERIAALGHLDGHELAGFLHRVGVVDAAGLGAQLDCAGFRPELQGCSTEYRPRRNDTARPPRW